MDFPNIAIPPYGGIEEEYEDNSLITEFEDGSQQSRKKMPRSRRIYTLTWKILSNADYAVLKNFIVNTAVHACNVFNWTNPLTEEVIEVRCTKFDKWRAAYHGFWTGSIELTEV